MKSNHSTDAPDHTSIPVITLKDPLTGLECKVLKPAYDHAVRTEQPIIIHLMPHLDHQPPTRAGGKLSEDDEVIQEIIGDTPGADRKEIIKRAESDYNTYLSVDSFKNRFRKGSPLNSLGYHYRDGGYWPPSVRTH